MDHENDASLRILAHVARADDTVRLAVRFALDALAGDDDRAATPRILRDETDLQTLIGAVRTPAIRRRTLVGAIAVACVDGRCPPDEIAVVERIREAFSAEEAIDPFDLDAESDAWIRRTHPVRLALEDATTVYLREVHRAASDRALSMDRYQRLVSDLAAATREIQQRFRSAVDRAAGRLGRPRAS